jgi:hypothetical protein
MPKRRRRHQEKKLLILAVASILIVGLVAPFGVVVGYRYLRADGQGKAAAKGKSLWDRLFDLGPDWSPRDMWLGPESGQGPCLT